MKSLIRKILRFFCTFVARRQVASMGRGVCVNFPCKFTAHTIIGNNCHFNGMKISGTGNVKIGNNFHSGKSIRILTSYHNYDTGGALPYDDTWVTRNVIIDDNVWLGEHVMILSGVHIGEGTVIQAGSVVVHDIPPCSIAGGHPAKVFKRRDLMHYYDLKQKGLYF